MRNMRKRLALWAAVLAIVLMIPALGNWPWTPGDYIAAAVLLLVAACTYEVGTRNISSASRRAAIGVAVAALLLLVWAELAVGVFTNWGS